MAGGIERVTTKKDIGIAPSGYHLRYYTNRTWRNYSELLSMVVRYSSPGPILDLGTGCGYLIEAANKWGMVSVGLEGSEDAVQIAKKRVPSLDVRLHCLSNKLPFSSESFQTVVLNQVIEHLEPEVMDYVLHESYRVLIPEGMILITSPSCFNKIELEADPTHINLISPRKLKMKLVDCGFESVTSFDTPLYFFGTNKISKIFSELLLKVIKIEKLSATANAMAFKTRNAYKVT